VVKAEIQCCLTGPSVLSTSLLLKLTQIYFQDIPIPPDCQTNGSNNCTDTSIPKKDVPLGRSSSMNEISEEKTPHSIKFIEDLNEPHSTDEVAPEETLQNARPNCDAASPQPPELPKDMSLEACTLSSKPSKKPRTKSPFSQSSPKSEYAEMKISAPIAGDEQPHNRSWQNRTVSYFSLPNLFLHIVCVEISAIKNHHLVS